MILGWMGVALAADVSGGVEPVARVACVRPVHFATPHPWDWSAEHVPVSEAMAVLVVADAELLRPRQVGQRVLYVDGWPAEILWTEGDRALVLAPEEVGVGPAAGVRAWFGDDTLPERVDAAHRAQVSAEAARLPALAPVRVDTRLELAPGALRTEWIGTLTVWAAGCGG